MNKVELTMPQSGTKSDGVLKKTNIAHGVGLNVARNLKLSFETHRNRFRLDLGISELLPQWRKFFSMEGLREDFIAGATVACIAVPLSLAIALASGVNPAIGLVTAIVASIVCALFGGTPLAVSGPAAAMAVLIASVVQQFGLGGLLVVGLLCGVLQLLTGVLGFGKIARFVPVPVVAGFTAGIGAIIFIGQLPRALGLAPPDQSHVFDVITHVGSLIHETKVPALSLALGTVAITFVLPSLFPRLPASLVAVVVPSLVAGFMGLNVETIGEIPSSLPLPKLPTFPNEGIPELLWTGLIVYVLASLETLLSSSAVDKLTTGRRHDPDQELIGQGLGNMISSLFGGIPVTGVIARSALNIQAGAKSRRAAIFHGLVLLAMIFFFAPVMSRIPTAVLAGVLLSVALRMLHPRELIQIWQSSSLEALIYLVTFAVILVVDLIVGVQAGLVAAFIISAIRLGKSEANIHVISEEGASVLSIEGPLTFMSSSKMETLRSKLGDMNLQNGLIMDLSEVSGMDASGATQLLELLEQLRGQNIRVAIKGLSPECKKILLSHDHPKNPAYSIAPIIASTDREILGILGKEAIPSLDRLLYGVDKFKRQISGSYESLFQKLADGQNPHTLFITCSDSRISPSLITSSSPGDLFIVRNVGNIIPPFGADSTPAEGAAVEFAVGVLNVKEVVVCGHSGCGAMKELISGNLFKPEQASKFPSVTHWLRQADNVREHLTSDTSPERAAKLNCLAQLQNLLTYPIIQEKLKSGEIRLHAWFYDIGKSELDEWDEILNEFVTIGSKEAESLERRIEAGILYQYPFNTYRTKV